jgi:DNA-binding HxlR family transcriptional regulator
MKVGNNNSEVIGNILNGQCRKKNVCPIKDIMASYGDKWSMYTILLLGQKKGLRFNELRSAIKGISQRMLTVTLRSLEKDGIVVRFVYPEIPQKVEYSLTSLGETLFQQLVSLAAWAEENFETIIKAREKFEKST